MKKKLVEHVAWMTGKTQVESHALVNVVLDAIVDVTFRDEKVTIVGFGTFRRKRKAAIENRINPATKKPLNVPGYSTISFSPSQNLRRS